ncbi:MAG: CoA pyrophosphatase [Gemmatimonadota bacterium]
MFDDPRIERLRRSIGLRAPRRAGLPGDASAQCGSVDRAGATPPREAGVALLVRPRDTLEVLLIRRAELHGDPWSGHVALPGGRRAATDADLLATACRETREEVGIPLHAVGSLLGSLNEVAPSSPLLPPLVIAPFVLAVPPDTHAHPDPREVQAALWVPVDALRHPDAISEITVELPDASRAFPSLVYADYEIWGLTLVILQQFLALTADG